MPRMVHIEDKDGRRYGILPNDFNHVKDDEGKTFAERGFKIVAWEDGEPYEPPAAKKGAGD